MPRADACSEMASEEHDDGVGYELLIFFDEDLRRRRRGSAPTRAHHQFWNVNVLKKITAHNRKKREKPFL